MSEKKSSLGLDGRARTTLVWMCVLVTVNQLGFGAIVPVIALYAEEFGVSKPRSASRLRSMASRD